MSKNKSMKITFVNGWHDDNKGDSGIVLATMALFKKRLPNADFGLVSSFPKNHPALSTAYRHLLNYCHDLEIAPHPGPIYSPERVGRYLEAVRWLGEIPLSLLRLWFPINSADPALRLIAESDLVVSKGGHIFYNRRKHPMDWARLYQHLFPLMIARRYHVPYILFGQSFGPITGGVGKGLISMVFRGANAISAREKFSRQTVLELGIPDAKVDVVPDAAFALRPALTERVLKILENYRLRSGSFAVVTVRHWPYMPGGQKDRFNEHFLNEMAKLANGLVTKNVVDRVALVAHTLGPTDNENDRVATRALSSRLKGEKFVTLEQDLRADELVALYGAARLLVGTRFHSVIFALAGGTPVYAVSYFGPKAHGIMDMLEMGNLCSDIETFLASETLDKLIGLDLDALAGHVQDKVSCFRKDLEDSVTSLVEQIK